MPGAFTQCRRNVPIHTTLFRWGSRVPAARSAIRVLSSIGLVAVTSAALLASAGAASASTRPQLWVATSGTPTAVDTSCATARYSTVQSAVTAAESLEAAHPLVVPAIELCPGTYQEQVTITKSLVITHAPRSGRVLIELPATPALSTTNCQAKATSAQVPQSVLEVCAAAAGGANTTGVSVSISGVAVQGDWPADICNDNLYGILVEGGASLILAKSTVKDIGADPLTQAGGCQGGVGVEAGDSNTRQVGHMTLTRDTIRGYQKNGVVADGSGSTGFVVGSTVTGAGATPYIAQNGIQISTGATGVVFDSVVSGNNYTGKGEASSAGILVYGGGASCSGGDPESGLVRRAAFLSNTLVNNDIGVALFNLNSTCAQPAGAGLGAPGGHLFVRRRHPPAGVRQPLRREELQPVTT
ncbi:MAG TPA: hypothetical protein VHT94_03370 [Streptosporangiaceae bacterium]|nr:hypothetical protein [Streptosporangiaceae bacterium]